MDINILRKVTERLGRPVVNAVLERFAAIEARVEALEDRDTPVIAPRPVVPRPKPDGKSSK